MRFESPKVRKNAFGAGTLTWNPLHAGAYSFPETP